jgi:hypothetical protein
MSDSHKTYVQGAQHCSRYFEEEYTCILLQVFKSDMGRTKNSKYRMLMYDIFILMAIGIMFIIFQYKFPNSIT